MTRKAVILLSGGLDSTTVLALASSQHYECYALSFFYNQRHCLELSAAEKIARAFNVKEHKVFSIDLGQFKGSALTDRQLDIPSYTGSSEIPTTYVPARNTIFLSIALGWAELLQCQDIFLGISAIDYSHYPDCRPEFLEAYQQMARLATKAGVEGAEVRIHAPLIHYSKAETIKLGMTLGVDYKMTLSCYQVNENGFACGTCDSCSFRRQGFQQAGVEDPTLYQRL